MDEGEEEDEGYEDDEDVRNEDEADDQKKDGEDDDAEDDVDQALIQYPLNNTSAQRNMI